MMKKLTALLLAILLLFSFSACTSNASAKDVNLEEVRTKITSELYGDDPGLVSVLATSDLLNLYGIQEADVKQSACFIGTFGSVFPDEVLMVEAVDSAAAGRIQEKLENRLKEVKNQSQSYDAENYALAQKCEVKTNGNYLCLFLSPKYAEIQSIYDGFFA